MAEDDDGFRHVEPQLKFVIPLKRRSTPDTSVYPTVSTVVGSPSQKRVGIRKYSDLSNYYQNRIGSLASSNKNPVGCRGSQRSVRFDPVAIADGSEDEAEILSSAIFHNVKHQLVYTVSDPLKRRANDGIRHATGSLRRATGSLRHATGLAQRHASISTTAAVRNKMNEISTKLSLPKFFIEQKGSITNETATDGEVEASSSGESEDPEFRELEERSQIVEKYEKGPEQEVEEWENPDLELYKVTDRYGFMHKDTQEMIAQENAEKKRIAKEVSREQKWLRMISRWSDGKGVSDKLRKRVWKGIPEKLRSLVWARLLGTSRYKQDQKGNVYRELLMRARLISKDIKQIDLDINRTYRDHMAFRRRYDVKQRSLFNVLAAYAMYNTEVGYCQGMSQIAALFLMYMDEEEAFWCMHALLVDKQHSMHGFFVPGFPKLVRFQAHYEKILQKYLPRLKNHLDKAGIPPIYVTKWWFGCFLDRVPFPLALRLWDVFLLEGDVILIAMAYNIMKMHEKTIRKLQMENFMEYIQTVIAQDFGFADEETMKSLQECLRKLHSDRMLLPAPPRADDMPETPTKPFGPVLSRSMIDIRLDIAEIQSRCSRANSVAGRSPAVVRRPRLPPSPTPVSKKLSQLPPRRMEPVVMENSHSSLSSTSTVKDTSPKEQITKVLTDIDKDKLLFFVPKSGENSVQQLQQQQQQCSSATVATRPVPTTRIEMKTTRPLIIEEVQRDIRLDNRNASPFHRPSPSNSVIRDAELESRKQQQQHLNQKPTTLSTEQQMRPIPENSWPSGSTSATRRFRAAVQQEVINSPQQPPEEPPIDYDDSAYRAQSACSPSSVRSLTPVVADSQAFSISAAPSYRDTLNFVPSKRNEFNANDYAPSSAPAPKFTDFEGTAPKFRSEFDESELPPQPVIRRTQRGSFYDNVPSPARVGSDSREVPSSLNDLASNQRTATGDMVYGVHAEDSSMERRYRRTADSPTLLETRRERRTTDIETRVVQLPNNVTCVRVGDNLDGDPPFRQQYRNIPVRREMYDNSGHSRTNANTSGGGASFPVDGMMEPRRHHYRSPHSSGTMVEGHTRLHEAHFSTGPSQLEAVQYERDAYMTNDQRPLERSPLHMRPDHYHYYNDKF